VIRVSNEQANLGTHVHAASSKNQRSKGQPLTKLARGACFEKTMHRIKTSFTHMLKKVAKHACFGNQALLKNM
jgi:hypothetical protein